MAVYWNNISFVNYGNLTLENNTNMVFDPQSQFENQNIFMVFFSFSLSLFLAFSLFLISLIRVTQVPQLQLQLCKIMGHFICEMGIALILIVCFLSFLLSFIIIEFFFFFLSLPLTDPFIINGDLSCKPGSKIQFNTDFVCF